MAEKAALRRQYAEAGLRMARLSVEDLVGTLGEDGSTIEYLRALADQHDSVQARIGVLLSFARPVDIQAAERHIVEHGLVDAEGNRVQ